MNHARPASSGVRTPTDRVFADLATAARVDLEEAMLTQQAAEAAARRDPSVQAFTIPFADGFAIWAGAGSPFTKVIGAGLHGNGYTQDDIAAIEEIERRFAERDTPVQVELSTLADPEIALHLSQRGYAVAGFEHVLGRALNDWACEGTAPGIEISTVGESNFEEWIDLVVTAAMTPDDRNASIHERIDRRDIELAERDLVSVAGTTCYLASVDGAPAGCATLRTANEIAQFGAATLPAFRGRGVHTALIEARLHTAAALGADLGVVTVQPGSTSHRNVWKQGFDLLYPRVILQRSP